MTVIAHCPTCKHPTFHLITPTGPKCKTCLARGKQVPDNRKHEGVICFECGGPITESEYSRGESGCCNAGVVPEGDFGKIDGFTN